LLTTLAVATRSEGQPPDRYDSAREARP
jgi:hypothetical protein